MKDSKISLFLHKIFIFIVTVLGIMIATYFYIFSLPKTSVKINKKNIIIGDSNTRWSMDDTILKSYANYSTGGEIYLFAYRKLNLLSQNNKIDTLLLSFSPHNIINNRWWVDGEGGPIENRMGGFYRDYSLEEHKDMFLTIPKNYTSSILGIIKPQVLNLLNYKQNGGGYNDIIKFGSYLPEKTNETQNKSNYYQYKKPEITEMEIKYLKKIISFCKDENIHLILIQPPKNYPRKDYKNYDHKEFYQYYDQNFKNIDFLDFSKLKLPKNAYWDMTHTDIVGAEYFSHYIQNNGVKKLLTSKFNRKNR